MFTQQSKYSASTFLMAQGGGMNNKKKIIGNNKIQVMLKEGRT